MTRMSLRCMLPAHSCTSVVCCASKGQCCGVDAEMIWLRGAKGVNDVSDSFTGSHAFSLDFLTVSSSLGCLLPK